MLAKGNITRPKPEVLDVVEGRCATRMMVRWVLWVVLGLGVHHASKTMAGILQH